MFIGGCVFVRFVIGMFGLFSGSIVLDFGSITSSFGLSGSCFGLSRSYY